MQTLIGKHKRQLHREDQNWAYKENDMKKCTRENKGNQTGCMGADELGKRRRVEKNEGK